MRNYAILSQIENWMIYTSFVLIFKGQKSFLQPWVVMANQCMSLSSNHTRGTTFAPEDGFLQEKTDACTKNFGPNQSMW